MPPIAHNQRSDAEMRRGAPTMKEAETQEQA